MARSSDQSQRRASVDSAGPPQLWRAKEEKGHPRGQRASERGAGKGGKDSRAPVDADGDARHAAVLAEALAAEDLEDLCSIPVESRCDQRRRSGGQPLGLERTPGWQRRESRTTHPGVRWPVLVSTPRLMTSSERYFATPENG